MKQSLTRFEQIFLPISLLCLIFCGCYFHSGWIVIVSTCLGMIGSVLNGTGRKFCYFFLLISSLLYAYISFENHYYGEAILHLCCVSPLFLYSAIRWFSPRKKIVSAEIFKLPGRTAVIMAILMVVGSVGYGILLNCLHSAQPYLNAISTAVTVGANYLLSRRMKEQWYAQLLSNAVLITLWLIASTQQGLGNLPLMVQNILFIVSNLRGAMQWNRQYRAENSVSAPQP